MTRLWAGTDRQRSWLTFASAPSSVLAAALGGALTACGWLTGEGQTVVPDPRGCPVVVVNELVPVDDGAESSAVPLTPPYHAEMAGRYGGPANVQLAAVVIQAVVPRATILEHTPPAGAEPYSQELTAEELQSGLRRSLRAPGLHHFSLRGADGEGCSQSFTIEAHPDSQVRAVDQMKGGSRIDPGPASERFGQVRTEGASSTKDSR